MLKKKKNPCKWCGFEISEAILSFPEHMIWVADVPFFKTSVNFLLGLETPTKSWVGFTEIWYTFCRFMWEIYVGTFTVMALP